MTDKTASVHWEGRGKLGVGKINTQTEALKSYPYGFASRFEDDRRGTNPEELLAAAHAACFTMAFSFACDAAGFATTADRYAGGRAIGDEGGGFRDRSHRSAAGGECSGNRRGDIPEAGRGREKRLPALQGSWPAVPEITLTAILRS
jgi:osmotically inducible protein OsmC